MSQSSSNTRAESDLPVQQDAPLFIDESLNTMLNNYLQEKPYKTVKTVVEAVKPVERTNPETNETVTVYALPRAAALYLLNDLMGKEEVIRTYMFIRQGYERALMADREAAAKLAMEQKQAVAEEKPKSGSKQKKIREHEVPDNIPPSETEESPRFEEVE